jgi:hypothetical protein
MFVLDLQWFAINRVATEKNQESSGVQSSYAQFLLQSLNRKGDPSGLYSDTVATWVN